MSDFKDTLRGIVAMLLSCLFFIVNDTIIKVVGARVPVGETLFIRSLIATAMVFAYVVYAGLLKACWQQLSRYVVFRAFAEGLSTILYLSGLMHLPIANTTAIGQGAPLAVTAAGAMVLGEKVGWRRGGAIFAGFVGILIVVRPGSEGFNVWAVLPLLSVLAVTIREISTRFVPPRTDSTVMLMATAVAVTLCCGGLSAFETWTPVSGTDLGMIAVAAVAANLGILGSIIAMRHGDISVVAVFRYSFIPYAVAIGYLVWGDVPDLVTVGGILIVLGSGIYVFYREHVRRQTLAAETGWEV